MSDEVTQPIEQPKPADAESSTEAKPASVEDFSEAKPEILQALPVETEESPPRSDQSRSTPPQQGGEEIQVSLESLKEEPVIISPLNASREASGDPVKLDLASPLDAISLAFKNNMARARELLVKARMAIQIKKKKKLEKVMNLFLTKKKIKNSDVRDLLHITDETATVYLNILKKEGKIQPNGKGGWIYYTKV